MLLLPPPAAAGDAADADGAGSGGGGGVRFVRLDEVPEGALGRVKFGGIKSVERAVEKIVRSYSQVQPT